MKTKTLILTVMLLTSCCLFSCNNDAMDEDKCLECLESVIKVYPNSKIYKNPIKDFEFYVVDSTGMRKVTTLNVRNTRIDGIFEYIQLK